MFNSYNCLISDNKVSKSNNYWSGYGIAMYESSNILVTNNQVEKCRRGIEVSGLSFPSNNITISNNVVKGNGCDSEYTPYNYRPGNIKGVNNYGIGTHGGAKNIVITTNTISDTSYCINTRGGNIKITNNVFIGRVQYPILLSFGSNVEVIANIYRDDYSGMYNKTISDGGANFNTRKPVAFAGISENYLTDNSNIQCYTTFKNNIGHSFSSFIEVTAAEESTISSTRTFNVLTIIGNEINITPQNTTSIGYFINNTLNEFVIANGSKIYDNNITSPTYKKYNNFDFRNNSIMDKPTTIALFIQTSKIEKMKVGLSSLRLQVSSSLAYGNFRVSETSLVTQEIGNLSNIVVVRDINETVTNRIGISLNNGILEVKNNLNKSVRIFITIFEEF